ncbi:hypothetical protein V6N11_077555 [Hibiscus sabdariffa]|uniref:Uncharacterized protein n=1 Tax=Hibiscus sabdariffa TaxID=183260 RepID=A0ABR2TDF2_9ROSI
MGLSSITPLEDSCYVTNFLKTWKDKWKSGTPTAAARVIQFQCCWITASTSVIYDEDNGPANKYQRASKSLLYVKQYSELDLTSEEDSLSGIRAKSGQKFKSNITLTVDCSCMNFEYLCPAL